FNLCQVGFRSVEHDVFGFSGALHAVDSAQQDFQRMSFFGGKCTRVTEKHGGAFENGVHRAQFVSFKRGAGGDQIADGIGKPETWGNFDGTAKRDDIGGNLLLDEKSTGELRVGSSDALPLQITQASIGKLFRDGQSEPASTEIQRALHKITAV